MHDIYFCNPEEVPLSHLPDAFKKVFLRSGKFDKLQQIASVKLIVGQDINEHIHLDMIEIFYVISGKIRVESNNITKILKKGDTFIVPPKVKHTIKVLKNAELFYFSLV